MATPIASTRACWRLALTPGFETIGLGECSGWIVPLLDGNDRTSVSLLPALAGVIAAAVQATGTTPGFVTACTWSFVILIAAVEAAIGFQNKDPLAAMAKNGDCRSCNCRRGSVVGFLDWQAYQKEYLADDLRVNFQIPHPNQIGTGELALTFLVATKVPVSVLLQETAVIEVMSTDFSNNPGRNNDLCKLLPSFVVGRAIRENWLHPGQKALHELMDKPPRPPSDVNEDFGKPFPFSDDGKLDLAFYDPKTVLVGGEEATPAPVAVEAGKSVAVVRKFRN